MSYQAGTGRPGTLQRRSQVAIIVVAVVSLLAVLLTLNATTGTADAQLSALPAGTTCFSFDESDDGSNALTHDSFLHTITSTAATASPSVNINGNVENIAVRNDTGEIYAYDAGGNGATDQLYTVDPATGAFGQPGDFGLAGLGDVDAMFFVSDEDGNAANDVLWVLVDPNVLTGYDVNGAVVAGPVTVAVPAGESIEGATWLAEPAPGEFFISYTTTGSGTTSILASLGTGTTPGSAPANIGGTEIDVEGFGTDGAGNLYLTTGGDSSNSLFSVSTTAATNLITDLSAVAGHADFESVDCAQPGITLTKAVTAGPTANGDGTFAFEFTFTIENTGHLPLSNIVLTDPYTFTPAGVTATNLNSTNDCPAELAINATCTYTDTVDLSAADGAYNNEATVDAVGSFGQPVTDVDDVDLTIPTVDGPSLAIVKTVVTAAADCPTSFADGLADRDAIEASIGDTVVYCINVINNGPGAATNVSVADSLTATTNSIGNLAANDEDSYNYNYTVAAEPETNTATVSGQDVLGNDVASASDTAGTDPVPVVDPALTIVKTVVRAAADCPGTVADGVQDLDVIQANIGETVFYCINVSNAGPGDAENVVITDDLASLNIAVGTLVAGAQTAEVYSHVVGAEPETNTATVTGEKTDGTDAGSDSDTAGTEARPALPDVEIIKTVLLPSGVCPDSFAAAAGNQGPPTDTITAAVGQFVKYCINVINNGPGPAFNVTVTDPQDVNSPRDLGNLAAGDEDKFLYLRDVLASPSTNVATVTADDSEGNANVSTDTDDAGVTPVPLGALGDFVWLDTNGNGIQDAGEPGVAGVTVTATGPSGTLTATTDAQGAWLIDGLDAGTYAVTFSDPQGRAWTVAEAGDDTNDSDANSTGAAGNHTVTAGATNDTVDGGLVAPTGALGNFVWLDTNGNGIQDAGEAGVAGVTVTATGPSGTLTATTDAQGAWLIDNLAAGTYTVTFADPQGRSWTVAEAGDDTNDSDANATGAAGSHTVTAGATNDTVDAGLVPPLGALGNFVWLDNDQDGIQDAGEPGVQGVTVTAIGPSGTLTASTDAQGAWSIGNLIPGTYNVSFSDPLNRDWTVAEAGDDTNDSDANATGAAGTHLVTADATNDTVDAGLVPDNVGAIGNFIWLDNDRDGIQDVGEPGVAGVNVTVTSTTDATVTFTVVTGAQGDWLVSDLAAGDYTVTFSDPLNREWTTAEAGNDSNDSDAGPTGAAGTHTVAVNQTNDTVDGGLVPPLGALGNFVWLDTDADGIQDPAAGVGGVTVTAVGPSGTRTTTTAADGSWLIDNLIPGTYTVSFSDPNGRTWTVADAGDDTNDSDAGQDGAAGSHVVAAGATNDTVDAGLVPIAPAQLGNYVWIDANGDGMQDADEDPVAGVDVNIWTADANGAPVAIFRTVTTDANGLYTSGDLPAGDYIVQIATPAGHTITTQGTNPASDTDSNIGPNGLSAVVTLAPGDVNNTIDAGYVPVAPAQLGNYVWIDANDNGMQDADEDPVAGVDVNIWTADANGAPVAIFRTVTTDANGLYTSGDLPAGDYIVQIATPAGHTITTQGTNPASDTDSNIGPNGLSAVVTLAPGDVNNTIDAGYVPFDMAELGNFVWVDQNANGIQDADEPGVPDVAINIWTADANGDPLAIVARVTSNADGSYSSGPLDAGDYIVQMVTPDGHSITTVGMSATSDTDSNLLATGLTPVVTLAAGEKNLTIDAGYVPLGSIGDFIFTDTNENGIQDAGEAPVAGAVITAFSVDAAGTRTQVGTATSDANGNYSIDGLAAGDYVVSIALPSGLELTTVNSGDDALDSDFSPASGEVSVTLGVAQANLTIDAGVIADDDVVPPTTNVVAPPEYPGPFKVVPNMVMNPFTPVPAVPSTGTGGGLAHTGSQAPALAAIAIGLLCVGSVMMVGARRERFDDNE